MRTWTDPAIFRRFVSTSWEAARAGTIADDVRTAAIQVMCLSLRPADRRAEGDWAINVAAEFLTCGCDGTRARMLEEEMVRVARSRTPVHPNLADLRGCLALAIMTRDGRTIAHRQIVRALRRRIVRPSAPLLLTA